MRAGALVASALLAAVAAGCTSSPAGTTTRSVAAPSTTAGSTAGSTTSTTVPPKTYFITSGKGDKRVAAVTLPSKWTVMWRFDCQKPTRKAPFELTSIESGHSAVTVSKQDGLGGGGQQPYVAGGKYSFGITTSCNWDLTLEATPSS